MPRKKKGEVFPGYVRVRQPDMEILSVLTKKAVGEHRTLTEFADLCGLASSTISRIINQKFVNPVSDGVIEAIARNADPDSGVTLEDLLAVHGLAPIKLVDSGAYQSGASSTDSSAAPQKDSTSEIESTLSVRRRSGSVVEFDLTKITRAIETAMDSRTEGPILERAAREAIQNELLSRGYQVSTSREVNIISLPDLRYVADFVIETDALKSIGLKKWAFDVHMNSVRPIVQKLSWIFGSAYLDSLSKRGIKFSLITTDKNAFDQVKRRFEGVTIPDCISVILMDLNGRGIVEEFQIAWTENDHIESVLSQNV